MKDYLLARVVGALGVAIAAVLVAGAARIVTVTRVFAAILGLAVAAAFTAAAAAAIVAVTVLAVLVSKQSPKDDEDDDDDYDEEENVIAVVT